MERGTLSRHSNRSGTTFHRQDNFRRPVHRHQNGTSRQTSIETSDYIRSDQDFSDIDDLDPDIEGDKFYASVQRLIDQFQSLDTMKQKQVNEELNSIVRDPQSTFDRGNIRVSLRGNPHVSTSRFASANDIPSYIDFHNESFKENDHEGRYFHRDIANRHSSLSVESSRNKGGVFGVRLSQRKPQLYSEDNNDYDSNGFNRTLSLDRNRSRYVIPRHVQSNDIRTGVTYDSDTAIRSRSSFRNDAPHGYFSDTGNRNRSFEKQILSPRHSLIRKSKVSKPAKETNERLSNSYDNFVSNRYPRSQYDIRHISSETTSSNSTPERKRHQQKEDESMRSSQELRKIKTNRLRGLLKKKNESNVEIVKEMGTSTEALQSNEPKILVSKNGDRFLQLTVDAEGFRPSDIQIITQGKLLQVIARGTILKTGSSSEGATRVYRELKRQFALPEVVNAEYLHGVLNDDGVLIIEGALGVSNTSQRRKSKRVKFFLD